MSQLHEQRSPACEQQCHLSVNLPDHHLRGKEPFDPLLMKILFVRRWKGNEEVSIIFNFDDSPRSVDVPVPAGNWRKHFDSEDESWGGKGSLLPAHLCSEGLITLVLNSKAFTLFVRVEEG